MVLPIQNLRSGTANKRPQASSLSDGQIAINYNEGDPGIYIKGHSGGLIKVSPTNVGTTAPNTSPATGGASGRSKGETWLDTTYSPPCYKVWNGSAWTEVGRFTTLYLDGVYKQKIVAMSGTAVDCSAGNYFTKTCNGYSSFSFTNVPSSCVFSVTLEITHTGGSINWPSSVKFSENNPPNLTTGKTHLFSFVTDNGGSRWRGAFLKDFDN
tara:strand:+ start:5018 stop:5650 length:633 start_codon:yes stop_codon:yes gene_type:complete